MRKSRVILLLLVVLACFSMGCKSEPSSAAPDNPKPQVTNYTITFNANGGNGEMPVQTFAKDETKALFVNVFTRTDKVFSGWNTKADGTGTPYTDAQNYTATADITLYAQWSDLYTYTVTFDKNDSSGEKVTQSFAAGISQNLKANTFTITNKVFTGWNTSADGTGTSYTDEQSYTATADIILYAQWADIAFVVTFDKNDGSGEKVTQPFAVGTAQNLKANTFTITNKVFTGWNTSADGTGASYTDGQSYTATADITLYAQWRNLFTYTVTFDKNDGNGTTVTQTFIEGKSQNLAAYSFGSIECGTFNSWNTQADGKGTSFEDEEEYTATAATTLYAQYDFEYLCFTAEEANSTVKTELVGNIRLSQSPNFEYSTDGFNWRYLVYGSAAALSDVGDKIYLRGNNSTTAVAVDSYVRFVMSGKIAASGNIMSLLDKTCELKTLSGRVHAFHRLFDNCSSLTTAPELPATTLAPWCYTEMFWRCTSLKEAPKLPATAMESHCYGDMFFECTSLQEAPELPATALAEYCYYGMFLRCTSLKKAPELPATVLKYYCYESMFSGCKSLTEAPEILPATVLLGSCYLGMFEDCISLTKAPTLPATTLEGSCYSRMFSGCYKLNYVKILATDNLTASSCFYKWLNGVASTGTLVKVSGVIFPSDAIPSGWTVVNI